MIFKAIQQVLAVFVCVTLIVVESPAQPLGGFQDQAAPQTSDTSASSSSMPTAAPLTSDQLDALVAPIALYPDALVAQVLGAAASPDQIAVAAYWLGQNQSLTGTALAQAVDQQTWDPSIKALTQFPAVLNDLAGNLAWTSNLGQAFENQQSDVMAAVQVMRAKAQAAGTLQSTPQIQVVQQSPQTIVIQPANPSVVYVPQYNPTIVYGAPYVVPLYTPPVAIAAATVSFGVGVAVGVALGGGGYVGGGGGGFSWGFHSWNCNWGGGGGGGTVIYQHNTYIHNTTYINNRTNYNGYHPWGPGPHGPGPYGPHPYSPNGFQPNGGHNGDHGMIGGNGGVQHPGGNRPGGNNGPGNTPNGGRNGDHGMIGGNGGVQHPDGNRPGGNNGPGNTPNGGRNGDHGMIGGNGGVQHGPGDNGQRPSQNSWNNARPNNFNSNPQRSHMSGDGQSARTEANRGRTSMHPPVNHPAPVHRPAPQHTQAPHGGGPRGH